MRQPESLLGGKNANFVGRGGITSAHRRPYVAATCCVAFLILIQASTALAETAYVYFGRTYTQVAGSYSTGGPYSLRATFVTSLSGSALDNLSYTNISSTIESYQFTDHSGLLLDNTNSIQGNTGFAIATNATGKITSWFVGASNNVANNQMQTNWNSPNGFQPGADFSETTSSFKGSYGMVSNAPGGWRMGVFVPLQGGTLANPVGLQGNTIAEVTGDIGGVGTSDFYSFNWAGGDFDAEFSMATLAGYNSEIQYELVNAENPNSVIASYLLNPQSASTLDQLIEADGLSAGNYEIGVQALGAPSPDPQFNLTFYTPVQGLTTPLPSAFLAGLLLMALASLYHVRTWGGRESRPGRVRL